MRGQPVANDFEAEWELLLSDLRQRQGEDPSKVVEKIPRADVVYAYGDFGPLRLGIEDDSPHADADTDLTDG